MAKKQGAKRKRSVERLLRQALGRRDADELLAMVDRMLARDAKVEVIERAIARDLKLHIEQQIVTEVMARIRPIARVKVARVKHRVGPLVTGILQSPMTPLPRKIVASRAGKVGK